MLAAGEIKLLSLHWLLERRESLRPPMPRRQDLPDEAFVPPDEALRLYNRGMVFVLSYRWLTVRMRRRYVPWPRPQCRYVPWPQPQRAPKSTVCTTCSHAHWLPCPLESSHQAFHPDPKGETLRTILNALGDGESAGLEAVGEWGLFWGAQRLLPTRRT